MNRSKLFNIVFVDISTLLKNIDIDINIAILENIDFAIYIDMNILENIDINMDFLENIDIDIKVILQNIVKIL